MDFQLNTELFLKELKEIQLQNDQILERAYRSIEICRNVLCKYKREVTSEGFDSMESEINFFKMTKQIPLLQLIYYSEIHSFEIQFPKADKNSQQKFIRKKINKLNRFFLYNLDFGQYINSKATHFDREYYTRNYLDTYHIVTSKFYFQDPDFCTPRDMLLGKFHAYTKFVAYLDQRLFNLKSSTRSLQNDPNEQKKLSWSFSNTDWVELVYALYAAGLGKNDRLSIIKVSKLLQQSFDFEPKDLYKTFQEIKKRKNSRTLFLDHLSTSILNEMDKSEE